MGDRTHIAWADRTLNWWLGCSKVSPGCQHCLDASTPIMLINGLWKQLGDVVIGDILAGCQELGEKSTTSANRTLQPSTVTAVWTTQSDTVEIMFSSGKSVICSPNHKWLLKYTNGRTRWENAEDLTLASCIVAFSDPDTAATLSDRFMLGYLAGATAGDGTMRIAGSGKRGTKASYWRIAVLESDMEILQRVGVALSLLGIEHKIVAFDNSGYKLSTREPKPMIKIEQRSQVALTKIATVCEPSTDRDWQTGWVSGFFDTDGHLSGSTRANGIVVRWSQAPLRNNYLERLQTYLDDMGLPYRYEPHVEGAHTVRLLLPANDDRVRALSMFAPALPRKSITRCIGSRIGLRTEQVIGIKRGPVKQLIDISTTTRTFVAAAKEVLK